MSAKIHPETLRTLRNKKNWTQKKLSDFTKVSLPTIKRIETGGDELYEANDRIAESLAKALGVSVDDLAKPTVESDSDDVLKKGGYRPLRVMIDPETRLSFLMVERLFGISVRSQILMAPLFTALLAEGSLAWRRKRAKQIGDLSDSLRSLGEPGDGHLAKTTIAAANVDEMVAAEERSIANRDLFGESEFEAFGGDFGNFDPSQHNPFADYLKFFAYDIKSETVSFVDDDDEPMGWAETKENLPKYVVGGDIVTEIAGSDRNAKYAIERGHVRLTEIPDELLGDDKKDKRVAWLVSRIPEAELAELEARDALFRTLGSDLGFEI